MGRVWVIRWDSEGYAVVPESKAASLELGFDFRTNFKFEHTRLKWQFGGYNWDLDQLVEQRLGCSTQHC